ncbi:MAG: hypothetical protein ACRDZ3_14915 [Acidimicrobiia bacterium]
MTDEKSAGEEPVEISDDDLDVFASAVDRRLAEWFGTGRAVGSSLIEVYADALGRGLFAVGRARGYDEMPRQTAVELLTSRMFGRWSQLDDPVPTDDVPDLEYALHGVRDEYGSVEAFLQEVLGEVSYLGGIEPNPESMMACHLDVWSFTWQDQRFEVADNSFDGMAPLEIGLDFASDFSSTEDGSSPW